MDKDNIIMIEFTNTWHGFKQEMVAIYNKNNMTEEMANELIRTEIQDDNLIVITKEQFNNVFKGLSNG
jgi:hypothetical protein